MRLCVALLLTAGVVAAADEPKAGAKDKEALQGLWQAVALEANGQRAPDGAVKAFQVRFKGDRVVFHPGSESRTHTFAIDPASTPTAMDLTAGDGPKKGQRVPCAIYRLDGDKLTVCLDKEGEAGKRPTEFKTAPGDGFALLTLERVKDKR